ncbi:hypothetical protein KIN20_025141 [Parelaphostrongylus tenuis]|uniref:Uncharacterized protein n=1 Tax=Parelaphostrongylus tenuis TaxID=148309 RepID=A0AAD5QWS1_PARTN|nr:hypothetical protein KIN20_025141 [Parelaphostrongylus tenuis]
MAILDGRPSQKMRKSKGHEMSMIIDYKGVSRECKRVLRERCEPKPCFLINFLRTKVFNHFAPPRC